MSETFRKLEDYRVTENRIRERADCRYIFILLFGFYLGGWTLIGNLTFDDPAKVTEISNTIFDINNGRLSDISKASEGRFLLDTLQYETLAEHTGSKSCAFGVLNHGTDVLDILS